MISILPGLCQVLIWHCRRQSCWQGLVKVDLRHDPSKIGLNVFKIYHHHIFAVDTSQQGGGGEDSKDLKAGFRG